MTRESILEAILVEQARALAKHGDMSMSGAGMGDAQRVVVLVEELGEVSRALLDGDRDGQRKELVQLAAATIAWLQVMP